MLKITTTHAYWWPVTVRIPSDGGRFEEARFEVRFEVLADDELRALSARDDFALLERVVVDWRDVQDEAGAELPVSRETKRALFTRPFIRAALIDAYLASANGLAARKN